MKELSVFPMGAKNDAYAKYFTGQSYLNMLSLEQVIVGSQAAAIGGISIMPNPEAVRCCWLQQAEDIIRNGAKRPGNFIPVM